MINIITMAGKGERFLDEGYLLPKPLIPIEGEPMIWKVIDCLPKATKWIFVVRKEHLDNFSIDKVIKAKIQDAIITVDQDLLGGASIFCAEEYIPDGEDILISSCDMGYLYDKKKFEKLKESEYDCILWTFTKDRKILANPKAWGYVVLENDEKTVKNISLKVPISENPFNDHAIVSTFWIRSKQLLYQAIKIMIRHEIKTNNEFYLDNLPISFNILNRKSCIFDVDLIISWGTPQDLHKFERISYSYKFLDLSKEDLSRRDVGLWNEYFENDKNRT